MSGLDSLSQHSAQEEKRGTYFLTPAEAALLAFMFARTVANVKGRAVQKLCVVKSSELVLYSGTSMWFRPSEQTHRLQVQTPLAIHGALPASCQCCLILASYGAEIVW
jgi:hypothetical protein